MWSRAERRIYKIVFYFYRSIDMMVYFLYIIYVIGVLFLIIFYETKLSLFKKEISDSRELIDECFALMSELIINHKTTALFSKSIRITCKAGDSRHHAADLLIMKWPVNSYKISNNEVTVDIARPLKYGGY